MRTLPKIWRPRIGCDLHCDKYGPPSHLANISCCQNIKSEQCIEIFWIFIICFWGATSCVTVSDKEFSDFPLEMWRSVTTGWLSRNVHFLLKLAPYGHRNKRKVFVCLFVFSLKQNKTSSNHWTPILLPLKVTLSLPIIAGLKTHIIFWKLSSMLEANSLNNRDVTLLSICFQIHSRPLAFAAVYN